MKLLPLSFDQNEWFILIGIIIFYLVIFIAPKRFSISLTVMIMLFTITVARLSDHLLSGLFLDMYDVMDSPYYELFDLLTYISYGPFGYFFYYFFDMWKPKGVYIAVYIIAWSLISIAVEEAASLFNVINYKEWKISYSFTYYLFMQALTLLFFKYVQSRLASPFKKGKAS